MVFLLYARRLRVAEPEGGATGSCTVGVAKESSACKTLAFLVKQ